MEAFDVLGDPPVDASSSSWQPETAPLARSPR